MSSNIHEILKRYWGFDTFRPLQEDIINSVVEGHDTLGLMPTGGGKSLTFQVPALSMEGICIVVTPLIALMKDQVDNLKKKGIKAAAIYSGMRRNEIEQTIDNCILGDYKFLYLSPERLQTDLFVKKLRQMKVSMLAIDESHCISQWGYDFRPQYLQIADLRVLLPDSVPCLALTATATPEVVKDIQEKLHFREGSNVFRKSFARSNLSYVVRYTDNKEDMLLRILNNVPGTSVVYCRNRKRTKEISDFLNLHGIAADYFHAGLSNETKDQRQAAWKNASCRVIVATNAFGMGIDKPDVRTVIHMDLPDSLEAYFQEAGRAGRDGKKAYAILLYSNADGRKLKKRIADTYPPKEFVNQLYDKLFNYLQIAEGEGAGYVYKFSIGDFCSVYGLNILQAENAINIIGQDGHLEYKEEEETKSRIMFTMTRDDLYQQKNNETEEKILNSLMRTYNGIFTDYALIDENVIGKQTGLDQEKIYRTLIQMNREGILSYVPKKKEPKIRVLRGRIAPERFSVSQLAYEIRKSQYVKKIEAVLAYATDQNHCRSQILLNYFGEHDSAPCGICDNCIKKKKKDLAEDKFATTRDQIIKLLRSVSRKPTQSELLSTLGGMGTERVTTVLRWMYDNGELENDENDKVSLTDKVKS